MEMAMQEIQPALALEIITPIKQGQFLSDLNPMHADFLDVADVIMGDIIQLT